MGLHVIDGRAYDVMSNYARKRGWRVVRTVQRPAQRNYRMFVYEEGGLFKGFRAFLSLLDSFRYRRRAIG